MRILSELLCGRQTPFHRLNNGQLDLVWRNGGLRGVQNASRGRGNRDTVPHNAVHGPERPRRGMDDDAGEPVVSLT